MKDLVQRSLTGLAYVGIIFTGTVIHPYLFAIVFTVLLLLTQFEFYKITATNGFVANRIVGLTSGFLLFIIFFLAANQIISQKFVFTIILIPFITFLAEVFGKSTSSLRNSLATLAGIVYIALPFSLLNFIIIPGNAAGQKFYPWILIGIFFIIWIYDSMAYAVGSLLGKHKISERISPGKSWEGLIGGAVFAVIMGILNAVLFPALSMTNWIIIALLTVIFGTCGDFFESKLKRETGVKDSGSILPGHGGFLDRFDSLLFAVPIIFVWLNLFGNI